MNNSNQAIETCPKPRPLKERLQHILATSVLSEQQDQIKHLTVELDTDVLACAAALLYLLEPPVPPSILPETATTIKMVRYRLDIGSQHQICIDTLKKVLVEESGVDKNNINNINIRGLYTLIDLPDSMPADIFQHLKTVEINERPLAIKRIKSRFKKRNSLHRRRSKSQHPTSGKTATETYTD
jgi:hypothetical protein